MVEATGKVWRDSTSETHAGLSDQEVETVIEGLGLVDEACGYKNVEEFWQQTSVSMMGGWT